MSGPVCLASCSTCLNITATSVIMITKGLTMGMRMDRMTTTRSKGMPVKYAAR